MFSANLPKEQILAHLNNVTNEWLSQFDTPPETSPVTFTITDEGLLCANGIILFPAQALIPDTCTYEVESLYLGSVSGDEYEIGINWPVVGAPYMSFVRRRTLLYVAP